jgi:Holliday junction resolvasome RuvABC ATP-dependent DNA helicase subunit
MFIAPKGCGKTMMAKAVGKHLVQKDDPSKPKPFLEINCSTIKSVKQLFNQIIIPHVNQKECTILFDEASELPKDVTMALLTVLNPNATNRTSFSVEDYVVDFDFSMQSFIFATTEAQHIFHALMDRCERIDLEEYTYDELGQIVGRVLPEVYFEPKALKGVSSVLRGNARAAQKMANNIKTYLASQRRDDFTDSDWAYLKHNLAILPLGLSPIELQVLEFLDDRKNCSLTYLAAKTGLTKACLQRDFEMYLQKHNLMEITTEGRGITAKGKSYLKNFKKAEKGLKKS